MSPGWDRREACRAGLVGIPRIPPPSQPQWSGVSRQSRISERDFGTPFPCRSNRRSRTADLKRCKFPFSLAARIGLVSFSPEIQAMRLKSEWEGEPMDAKKDKYRVIDYIDVDGERLFGYTFATISINFYGFFVFPNYYEELIEKLGAPLLLIGSIAPGIVLFTLYRRVIGEFLFFPVQHLFHGILDLLFHQAKRTTSPIFYLKAIGVKWLDVRSAFDYTKSKIVSGDLLRDVEVGHGEVHIIYINTIISFGYYAVSGEMILLIISVFSLMFALFADTKLHAEDCAMIKAIDSDRLRACLRSAGLLSGS